MEAGHLRQAFREEPRVRVVLREALDVLLQCVDPGGAAVAALLVVILTLVFRRLVTLTDPISAYGVGFAISLAMLTWLYLAAHASLLGDQLNQLRSGPEGT